MPVVERVRDYIIGASHGCFSPSNDDAKAIVGIVSDELTRPDERQAADRIEFLIAALTRIATVDMGGGFLGAQACREIARTALAESPAMTGPTISDAVGLTERCEQATGPSAEERQLVIDAYNLLFPHELTLMSEEEKGDDRTRYARTMHRVRFTTYINTDYERASLDAAMMLVPEGWRIAEVGETVVDCSDPWAVRLFERCKHDRDSQKVRGDAATFALALCAASLRATSGNG